MKVEQKLSIIFLNIGPANKGNKMPQLSPYNPIPINCVSAPRAAALKKPRIFPILRPRRTRVRDTRHAARVEGGAARVISRITAISGQGRASWGADCMLDESNVAFSYH